MTDMQYHRPVLLQEVMEGLDIQPDGTYVDATFGGGGHTRALLEKLGPEGRLFGFDQDEDAYTRNSDGTGLGFPIARHLAELHGGTLELTSTKSEGTCARVTLPPSRSVQPARNASAG